MQFFILKSSYVTILRCLPACRCDVIIYRNVGKEPAADMSGSGKLACSFAGLILACSEILAGYFPNIHFAYLLVAYLYSYVLCI